MKKVFRNSSYDIYNVAKLDSQRNSLKPSSGVGKNYSTRCISMRY